MYHVLLVDDEKNVLEFLKNNVSWPEFGVGAVFTAHDGLQALSLLKQHKIDLIITDIKMPALDGISLIQQVKILYPHIRCILLTAYSEFEYAKQAITLGVENYLLKPVIKEELEQTVQKSLSNLYNSSVNNKNLLRENILQRWVHGNISSEELSEKALVLGLNLYLPEYCVICFDKKSNNNIHDFLSLCLEMLANQKEVYPFWDENGKYTIIIGGQHLNINDLSEQISHLVVKQGLGEIISISLGIPTDAESLQLSHRIACDNMELLSFNQSGDFLLSDYQSQSIDIDYLVETIRFLFFETNIKIRYNGYRQLLLKLYQNASQESADSIVKQLLIACMKVLITECPLQNNFHKELYGINFNIAPNPSKEDFIATTEKILNHAQSILSECHEKYSPIIQLAIRYALNSVMEGSGGSVKEFCALNGMNSAYLGHLFKQETGIFFSDYLTQCRINRSIVLLKNPNNKIKDIAEKVGFMSASYYVKCFREMKGISPSKYRTSVKK